MREREEYICNEDYIRGLELVLERLSKLKDEFQKKAETKHQNLQRKYDEKLKLYEYDANMMYAAWKTNRISRSKYISLLNLLLNGADDFLPEDAAVVYLNGLLLYCESEKYIELRDQENYERLQNCGSHIAPEDWAVNETIYMEGRDLACGKMKKIREDLFQKERQKNMKMYLGQYEVLRMYGYDELQIDKAYETQKISLKQCNKLIKLLEKQNSLKPIAEHEAVVFLDWILRDYEADKKAYEMERQKIS